MAYELNAQDSLKLQGDLDEFVRLSDSYSALLCDKGGAVMVSSGSEEEDDLLAALTAGSFAATRELARTIGEDDFEAVFHQGVDRNIYISGICEEVLLLVVFEQNSSQMGLVRMYARNVSRKIRATIEDVESRESIVAEDPTLSFVLKR